MNTTGNTYWLSNRGTSPQVAGQAAVRLPVRDVSREFIPDVIGWLRQIPSWVFLAMILFANLGICSTVIMRSRAELKASSVEYSRMTAEIDSMRRVNSTLQSEVRRLANDPGTIESAARERLGMVRPNDIVVPIEGIRPVSSLGTLSFVR